VSEPTPREVLYAIVSAALLVVILVLIVGAASAGLVPVWWTALGSLALLLIAIWSVFHWRRTARLLMLSIGLLAVWFAVTIVVANA
jgi:hypothetical protein